MLVFLENSEYVPHGWSKKKQKSMQRSRKMGCFLITKKFVKVLHYSWTFISTCFIDLCYILWVSMPHSFSPFSKSFLEVIKGGLSYFCTLQMNLICFQYRFSFTHKDDWQDKRESIGSPFCNFPPLMKIQTFICKFATEMTTAYF